MFATKIAPGKKKFHSRAASCVFIGYSSSQKGYKLLDMETNQVFISRHVVFHENHLPFHYSNTEKQNHNPIFLPMVTPLTNTFTETSIPFSSELTSNSQISNNTNSSSFIEQLSTNTSMTDISSDTPPIPARKSTRVSKPPSYLNDYKCNSIQSSTALSSHWCNLVSLNDGSIFSLLSSSDSISNEPSTYAEAAGIHLGLQQ